MKQEDFIDEINFAVKKMEVATQELKEARSTLGLGLEIKDILAALKIVSYGMLSDIETREAIKDMARITKDKNILKYIEGYEDVQQK